MIDDALEPSTSFTSSTPAGGGLPSLLLRPRREPFEHGLLLPKLIFSDGTLTLTPVKQHLLQLKSGRVDAVSLADALQISAEHASLALDTLAAVLPGDHDSAGADVHDLILFLYMQSYKRLVPRAHKDSVAAVADVWPSTSAFDGYLSALSPLQLVRSNTRRFMPSQADDEAHQLSYLQKHLANILALLADPAEGQGDESLILTMERFEHLDFLIQFEKGCDLISLSQATPFFANSDPDMPAAPVSVVQVHDWISENITTTLEHISEKTRAKENGPSTALDADVTMADASPSHSSEQNRISPYGSSMQNNPNSRSQTFVEGISKASLVKKPYEIKGHSVKVLNCHDSVIYLIAPLRYAIVYGCSHATVILGAIGKALRVEHCESVQVIAATKRICIANCRDCVFYLGVNQRPLILGDNHKLQVAPFNTYYPQLEEHLAHAGVDSAINKWDDPLVLGVVDPHDSLSHPAGTSEVQAESASCLDPEQFANFWIPNWSGSGSPQLTRRNPFPLPSVYLASQRNKRLLMADIQNSIRDLQIDESRKRELACALHVHFKDWLYASGNIRQLYCLHGD